MIDATYTPANLGDLTTAPTRYHKCGPGGSYTFLIEVQPKTTVTDAGSLSTSTSEDHNVTTETGASTRTDYLVAVSQLMPPSVQAKTVTLSSSDSSVIAEPSDGLAVGQASGSANIIARSPDGEVSVKPVSVAVESGQTVTFATGPVDGSLNKHCYDQIENRITGVGRESMDLWSTRNNSTSSYNWNANCWGADLVNKTCMSPYNTSTGNGGGGALVTPRHVVFTHHLGYYPKVGAKIRYVTPSNATEEFTIDSIEVHPYNIGFIIGPWDMVVAKLDRDVPSSIGFAKVLPQSTSEYLPTIPKDYNDYGGRITYSNGLTAWLRACHTSQRKTLATTYIKTLPSTARSYPYNPKEVADYVRYVTGTTGTSIDRYPENALGDTIVAGDSGAPAFVVVNGELVLASLWTSPTSGYPYYTDATVINGMLDDLGGGYNLTEVDLSEFPTY